MDTDQIHVHSSQLVHPARDPDRPSKFHLSSFDKLFEYTNYQKRLLFYRSAPPDVLDQLKDSLAEVLVYFYPMASRIRAGDHGLLELDCSSVELSAKFTVAATGKSLKEMEPFEPSEFSDSLCQLPPLKHPWKLEYPLLFVQITRFRCGGICVGIGYSHQVTDGASFWHFLTCWGEIARTGKITSPLPDISYNYKALELEDEDEYMRVAVEEFGAEIRPDLTEETFLGSQTNSLLATRQYRFDRRAIAELKSRARAAGGNDDVFFSTYVVLCAEFWRRMVVARGFDDADTARFFVLANCRERVAALPKHYFGNAVVGFPATARVGELKHGGLPLAARLIHDKIKAFNGDRAERFLSFSRWMQAAQRRVRVVPYGQSVSSNQHPVDKVDFGFEQPDGVTFGTGDLHEGKVYLFPSRDGGVVVTAVLKEDDMKKMVDHES